MGITKFSSTNSSATLTLALCILGIAVQFLTTKDPVPKKFPDITWINLIYKFDTAKRKVPSAVTVVKTVTAMEPS
mgnify:CR=1 FL=1